MIGSGIEAPKIDCNSSTSPPLHLKLHQQPCLVRGFFYWDTMATLMPPPRQRFSTNAGVLAAGCKLYTFAAGTSTPKAAFADAAGLVPLENPITLDAKGEALIYFDGAYRLDLKTAAGVQVTGYPVDDFTTPDLAAGPNLLRSQLSAPSGGALSGYSSTIAGPTPTTILDKLRLEPIHVEEFPNVVADGITNDGPAIRAAIVACMNAGKLLVFGGSYAVDRITIQDAAYNFGMHSNNAQFTGIATSNQPGVIEIVNCVDFHMTGNWRIDGANNTNYDMGMCIRVQAGTSQATSRVNITNPTFRNCAIGIGVGRYNIDYQCSEINIFGANFFKCPIAVYNGGLNTGAQYIGCNLVSEPNSAFSIPEKWLWQEGGFVKVNGGSVFTNPTASAGVLFNPCAAASGNVYGVLNVNGTHVEMNSALLTIQNSRALSSPVSIAASIAYNSCAGFSGAPAASDFVFIGDSTYAGVLDITSNNWYSAPVRTAYNISSASPLARILVDKISFGQNFRNWLGGVFGGKIIHDMQPILQVTSLAGISITSGSSLVMPFANNNTTAELGRYSLNYSAGTFLVPPGGFSRLEVSAALQFSGGGLLFWGIRKNGAIIAYGSPGAQSSAFAVLYALSAGDTIDVYATATGATASFDGAVAQTLLITGAT